MGAGTLYLIPTTLGESALAAVIPQEVQQRVRTLDYFVVENPKSARAYLKQIGMTKPLQDLHITTLNVHTPDADVAGLAAPLLAGHDLGIMSEAGCPGVADPGAKLVLYAQQRAARVVPLVGPSSILLALMASGLNGQSFAFHGYLPVADAEREKVLRELEMQSRRLKQTQIFIETPYRNQKLVHSMLERCKGSTLLCVAAEISLPGEDIRTMTVAQWKKKPPQLDRRPTLFLLLAD
ncbi:MAG: SAM-dependent methyltransferase [Burkholderiales bacterium]|nr:SAM-dependent methyltransferase [Burkholderiales bacterium]